MADISRTRSTRWYSLFQTTRLIPCRGFLQGALKYMLDMIYNVSIEKYTKQEKIHVASCPYVTNAGKT